jgi:hypothetical protein
MMLQNFFEVKEVSFFPLGLTTIGTVRWKVDIEFVTDMIPVGVSNIVSDHQGDIFYTISWLNETDCVAKVCRITNAETSHPAQKRTLNNQLLFYVTTPLVLIEKYDLLVTAASENVIDVLVHRIVFRYSALSTHLDQKIISFICQKIFFISKDKS